MSIDQLITTYGLLALYLGVIIEGQSIVFIAGIFAHRGDFGEYGLLHVMIVAVLATITGDNLNFFLGRIAGKPLLRRFPGLAKRVSKIREKFSHHPFLIIMGFRWITGLRITLPVVVGMSRFKQLRFFFMDIFSALAWSCSYAFVGYQCGRVIDHYLVKYQKDVKQYELWIVLGIIIVVGLFLLYKYWKHYKTIQKEIADGVRSKFWKEEKKEFRFLARLKELMQIRKEELSEKELQLLKSLEEVHAEREKKEAELTDFDTQPRPNSVFGSSGRDAS